MHLIFGYKLLTHSFQVMFSGIILLWVHLFVLVVQCRVFPAEGMQDVLISRKDSPRSQRWAGCQSERSPYRWI